MAIERVVKMKNPALFDCVIGALQDGLADKVAWLDHIFGRCERLVKETNSVRRYTPNIYMGGDEYLLLTPDQGFGNYCYFVLDDGEEVNWVVGDVSHLQSRFSLVVWVDMRTIPGDDDTRNTERVKAEILRMLNGGIWVRTGSITVDAVYGRAENVFSGFTLDEVDNQFLMSPFAGFRFEGTMRVKDVCEL